MVARSTAAEVHAAVRAGVAARGKDAPPLLLAYAERLLDDGPLRFFAGLEGDALVRFVARRFEFARVRDKAPFALRIDDAEARAGADEPAWTVIEIVVDDRPFLIDSVQNHLLARGHHIQALLHPILTVQRDAKGALKALGEHDATGKREAHMCFLVLPVPTSERPALLEALCDILCDVIRSVDDFPAVEAQLKQAQKAAHGVRGGRAVSRLLEWFHDRNFVFMGSQTFDVRGDAFKRRARSGLGLFHPELEADADQAALLEEAERFLQDAASAAPFCTVEESTRQSRMHRRERIALLLISAQPAAQRSEALVVAGVFTHRSLRVDALEIPLVEAKLGSVLGRHEIAPQSYKHKEVLDFFNGLPRFELFRLSESLLERLLGFFLGQVDQPRTEVALVRDEESGAVRVLVALPGSELPQATLLQVRERVEHLLELRAQDLYVVRVSTFAILALVFAPARGADVRLPEPEQLDEWVREELLSRGERLLRLWTAAQGDSTDEPLMRMLIGGFSEEYDVSHSDAEVLADLAPLEALVRENEPQFALRHAASPETFTLRIFGWEKLSLSRLMPVLSNLRVLVEEEDTYEIRLPDGTVYLHTFVVQAPPGRQLVPEQHGEALRQLLFAILDSRAENDPLNALLIAADFDWRQINVMQLLRNYLMQVGAVYTKRTINETLIRRDRATRALFGVFRARFDPHVEPRDASRQAADQELEDAQREIDNLTEDRIFKGLANLIRATVRTNFYRDLEDPVIALKLASAAIDQLPNPRPVYEIAVYGPLMEGIHLRGDKIARGGIRYSDRPDDFRTEVLGLMATQQKKNALIVPLGSKGGFVVKDLAPWQGNARAAGDAQYRVFIRALLSVTDNLAQGRVVPPPRVVRHDEDDPYLVVAADKGTAHLSDTANAVSEEQGFWLGDAFASGGSNGYDHKMVGITARGAWESVKRLFWERGVDVQREPVRVVGIGDMSGDVFGNGLLSSRTLKLIGAFDHRHIFLDPEPDAAASFQERERLFRLPRSAWTDYDTSLISAGGGVYPRSAKSIALTPQVQALLSTQASSMSGEELIRSLLCAPVDLLWNGGIGTYVKSADESQASVGDPSNDAVRVDARDLRVRVVGEGGNLGFTQLARIELDLAGGGVHTDAIDNAGGVNMSDHEVNLKILLAALLETGQLKDLAARNALLHELEPEVTAAVLRANFRQVLVISMDRLRSMERVGRFVRLVDLLAAEGGLDRRQEAIPNAQRFQGFLNDGHGVPRPVLSVLLAYIKMLLYRRLVDSPLVDDPALERSYRAYFPRPLVERFDLSTAQHALRRQIVATVVTNRVIDQAGTTFVPEMAAFTGASWPDVAQAYLIADSVVEGPAFRECIYAQASVLSAETQYRLLMELETLLTELVRWQLLNPGSGARGFAREATLRKDFLAYSQALAELLAANELTALSEAEQAFAGQGLRPEAARLAAMLPRLRGYPRVSALADDTGLTLPQAYRLAAAVDGRLHLSQIEASLAGLHAVDRMQKRFADGLLRSLDRLRPAKLRAVAALRTDATGPAAWLEAYVAQHTAACSAYEATARQVFASERPEAVALAVLIDQLEAI